MCSTTAEAWRLKVDFLLHSTVNVIEIPYSVVYDYLHSKKYPENCEETKKRAISKKAQMFSIRNGVLFYTANGHNQEWVSEETKQRQIIQSVHSGKLGGHFGRHKTQEKITSW